MRESVLYVRGRFPFGVEPGVSEDAVRDARIVLDLSAEQLRQIRRELEEFPSFLDRTQLQQLLSERLQDETQSRGLARFITVFGERLRKTGESTDALTRWLGEWIEENQDQQIIRPDEIPELRERLELLLSPLPCLARQAKAESLTEVTGHPLESLDIICDVRPIFDDERNQIEGMMPLTVLRLVCKGVDGLPIALEATLSERDVRAISDAAQKALKKLNRIHDLLEQKQIVVPRTELTKRVQADAE